MSVKIAINGFGRIGRLAFRQLFGTEGFEFVAINDVADPAMAAHLLKYDSTQGRWALADKVAAGDGCIIVDGRTIRVLHEGRPAELPWHELGVDLVLECTGDWWYRNCAQAHIDAGARWVVISAHAGRDRKTIVFGVNEDTLSAADSIISTGSCVTNCAALLAGALHNYVPIVSGVVTALHAYAGDQTLLDRPFVRGYRRKSRAASINICPTYTEAVMQIGLVLPELSRRLVGSALRVPVPVGSAVILTAVVEGRDITVDGLNAAMKAAVCDSFGYTDEPLVSCDVIGTAYGALFDATQTMVNRIDDDTCQVQVTAWFDNEYGYVSQMVRTIKRFAALS